MQSSGSNLEEKMVSSHCFTSTKMLNPGPSRSHSATQASYLLIELDIIKFNFISFHVVFLYKVTAALHIGGRGRQHPQKNDGNAARESTHHRPKDRGGRCFPLLLGGCCLPSFPSKWCCFSLLLVGAAVPLSLGRWGCFVFSPLSGGAASSSLAVVGALSPSLFVWFHV